MSSSKEMVALVLAYDPKTHDGPVYTEPLVDFILDTYADDYRGHVYHFNDDQGNDCAALWTQAQKIAWRGVILDISATAVLQDKELYLTGSLHPHGVKADTLCKSVDHVNLNGTLEDRLQVHAKLAFKFPPGDFEGWIYPGFCLRRGAKRVPAFVKRAELKTHLQEYPGNWYLQQTGRSGFSWHFFANLRFDEKTDTIQAFCSDISTLQEWISVLRLCDEVHVGHITSSRNDEIKELQMVRVEQYVLHPMRPRTAMALFQATKSLRFRRILTADVVFLILNMLT